MVENVDFLEKVSRQRKQSKSVLGRTLLDMFMEQQEASEAKQVRCRMVRDDVSESQGW